MRPRANTFYARILCEDHSQLAEMLRKTINVSKTGRQVSRKSLRIHRLLVKRRACEREREREREHVTQSNNGGIVQLRGTPPKGIAWG